MIKVAAVEAESDAERAGILAGDKILRINEEEIRDRLDFEFHRSGEFLDVEVMRGEQVLRIGVDRDPGQVLGIEPEVMKIHLCKNNCVFCFVHQTPKGMRKSLYVKDEDYRYSFLDGHFTTLSNMKEDDWQRVLEQKLSPIYVSVHSTDPVMRAKLLKNEKLEPIMERLRWMVDHNIDFHTQLVVIPDWNDREYLERSLSELRGLYPSLLSISVVPIGLTARRNLPDLRLFTREDAVDALERVERHGREAMAETGENFILASDEMYIAAGREMPPAEFYGGFSQYENGVGTIRTLIDDFARELPYLPKAPPDWEITVLTASLASETQRTILDTLKREKGLSAELIVCENLTFGSTVTVTGLLCGKDFAAALEKSGGKGPVLIPPNSLNRDSLFLDDMSPQDLSRRFGRKVMAPNSFREYFPLRICPAFLRALAAPAAALLLGFGAGAVSAQDPFDDDEPPQPIPRQEGRALREVRSVPYPSGALYLRKGITGAFLGGKYRNLGEEKSLYQWQGEVGFFYTSWFSAGLAFKVNAGEPSETEQKVLNRYYANARFHKAWNRASIYIGPQIGVDNLNILTGPPPKDTIDKVLRDPIDNTNMGLGIEAGVGWKVSRWVGLTLGTVSEYSLVDNESSIYGNNLNLRLVPGVAIDVLAFTDTLRELVPALYLTFEAHLGFLVLQENRTNNDRAFLMGVGLAF